MQHHHLDSRSRRSYGPNFDVAYSVYNAAKVGPGGRLYDTLNPFKEARKEATMFEVNNRISFAGGYKNLPTDFRMSAFDLFTKLQTPVDFCDGRLYVAAWRLAFRETYRKIIAYTKQYRHKAAKQYAAGYREKPAFLTNY